MHPRILLAILLVMTFMPHGLLAQEKTKKQVRQERKEARKRELFMRQKQAILDTNFRFQTQKILSPYTSSNGAAGYLSIDPENVRVQEMDWVERVDHKVRIRDIAKLKAYTVLQDAKNGETIVTFRCQVKGKAHQFTLIHRIEGGSELAMEEIGGKTMRYSGVVKSK